MSLCDRLGLLVQEEFFDEWDYPKDKRLNQNESLSKDYITRSYTEFFTKYAEKDLKNTILRDRNHPSVFQWSIGNEIEWAYPRYAHATGYFNMDWKGNYFWEMPPISRGTIKERFKTSKKQDYQLHETAQKLANWVREIDTTRPVIANCILPSASYETGYTDALDIVGYSYRRVLYDYGKTYYPDKPVMGTENLGQWHEWKAVLERPYIAGLFLWTGIDYLGETHNEWPQKSKPCGLLDLAGFEKPSYHMFKSLWSDKPHAYLATQTLSRTKYKIDPETGIVVEKTPGAWQKGLWFWHDVNPHWNYDSGDSVVVEVYTNGEEATLWLEGKNLGVKRMEDFEDHIMKWMVPYQPGRLSVQTRGKSGNAEYTIHTAGVPAAVKITTDKTVLSANGTDVAHIVAQLTDAHGHPVMHKNTVINFEIEGPARLLGVDNGYHKNTQPFQANQLMSHQGKSLMILQATQRSGEVVVKCHVAGMNVAETTLKVE